MDDHGIPGADGELERLLAAVREWTGQGRRVAWVTLVHAWGSTYRRPGAQMAVSEGGQWEGTISGGCLEADIAHVAGRSIREGRPLVARYDLEEDAVWGLGLGCGGGVDVLIEPFTEPHGLFGGGPAGVGEGVADGAGERESRAVVTLLSGPDGVEPTGWGITGALALEGLRRLYVGPRGVAGDLGDPALNGWAAEEARRRLADRAAESGSLPLPEALGRGRLFFHLLRPVPVLLVLGAGHDAVPLVRFARAAGFRVVVADARSAYARRDRFPEAEQVLVCEPADTPFHLSLGEHDYVVIMNHHRKRDQEALRAWLNRGPGYVGVLGPRRRTREMLEELGIREAPPQLYAPVGLDLRAETPEQVALSIVAELLAHRSRRTGGSLRDRPGSIH